MILSRKLIGNVFLQSRKMSAVVTGPPSNTMGLVEKIAHGSFIVISCLATPAWVLGHMLEYRSRK